MRPQGPEWQLLAVSERALRELTSRSATAHPPPATTGAYGGLRSASSVLIASSLHFSRMRRGCEGRSVRLSENFIGALGPSERLGVGIGGIDIGGDGGFKVGGGSEHAGSDGAVRQQREEAFDRLIHEADVGV